MFLKRFVFINWGNIPSIEFEFGPINLFSGGNGSGKTTAADAIQTVMTAAHENLFQFNPGQDETTQRGAGGKRVRTLSSYVLGCDDGSFARLDPTDGYLAAVFNPNKGEDGAPFTAVIAVRAWLDTSTGSGVARQDDAQFYILPGVELEQGHFVRESTDEKYIVPLPKFMPVMVEELGKKSIEKYDTKKAYLRRLYAILRGRPDTVSDVEAIGAARAFSRFMAYKPVKGINKFVADEILEQRDLGEAIRSISSQLKTIHGMKRDADHLVESIDILDRAKDFSQTYIDQWIDLNVMDYTLAQSEYLLRQQDYIRGKKFQVEKEREQGEVEEGIEQANELAEQVRGQLISLEAQRQGVDALRKKDELEKDSVELDKKLVAATREVIDQDKLINFNLQLSEEIAAALADATITDVLSHVGGIDAQTAASQLLGSRSKVLPDIHVIEQRDFAGTSLALQDKSDDFQQVQSAHNQWLSYWRDPQGSSASYRDRLADYLHQRKSRLANLGDQRAQKQREIDRLDSNQVTYPQFVERAIRAIEQQCPQADPRVLCDHVEVTDANWQAAIEGYFGGARFSIIVAPEFEAEAIRIVRSMPGRDNRARVIQGEKAADDAARIRLDDDSIITLLDFSHSVARSYLVASYGAVLQVSSPEALRHTRRGLTEAGMGSGNYSMWRCDLPDSDLVFGIAARQRAMAAKASELQQIETDWHNVGQQVKLLAELLRNIDALQSSNYYEALRDVLATQRFLIDNEALIEQLDLSEHADLEARLQDLNVRFNELTAKRDGLVERKGEIRKELEGVEKQLKALSGLQEKNTEIVQDHEDSLNAITKTWPDFDAEGRLAQADEDARVADLDDARKAREEIERQLHTAERRTSDEIQAHNQHCRPADAIVLVPFNGEYDAKFFQSICDVRKDIDRVYNLLKNNILVEKHAQLQELQLSFNNAFVSHLCHAIYQALSEGKRQIDLLNQELNHHRFGADRETFRFAYEWIPEYRDYSRFFEEVIKTPGLGDDITLFDADLSKKSSKVLDELLNMLLDEDEQRAMRDLERIADYRNYRRYEIYKEVEGKDPIPLSEYGTGSGGQLETPAYIIRAAAITSAFRFTEGKSHLRMVLVDEAFSKMDEIRSREVINYLTESLGLQLVFIMPTSKCGPYMDLISNEFVFAKVPSAQLRGQLATRVLVDRKQCNQDKIRALWSNHRQMVFQQAEIDFMAEFVEQPS